MSHMKENPIFTISIWNSQELDLGYQIILEYRGAQAPLFLAPAEGCLGAFGPSGRPLASSWGLRPLHRTWHMSRHVENKLEIP